MLKKAIISTHPNRVIRGQNMKDESFTVEYPDNNAQLMVFEHSQNLQSDEVTAINTNRFTITFTLNGATIEYLKTRVEHDIATGEDTTITHLYSGTLTEEV